MAKGGSSYPSMSEYTRVSRFPKSAKMAFMSQGQTPP
jgi:hypothetical protein